jgi:predicted O-methyltransferase YrrM
MKEYPPCLMSPRETAELVKLADAKRVLELGTWHGYTTIAMARVAVVTWTVDHHGGDVTMGEAATLDHYLVNVELAGVGNRIVTIVGRFEQVLPWLMAKGWDLVLVDGAHDAGSVMFDCLMANRLCHRPGIVAVHDWDRYDVNLTNTRVLGEPGRIVDSLALFERQ